MKTVKMILVIALSIVTQIELSSQTKWEREYRAGIKNIPAPAKKYLNSFPEPRRLKWYAEESDDGKTFEAKFIFNGLKHSIEFDSIGNLLDIEIAIDYNLLSHNFIRQFDKNLLTRFTGYKVIKVQKHIKGDDFTITGLYENPAELHVQYEIVVRGYFQKKYRLYEIMADSVGSILTIEEIVLKNTDNLEY